MTAARKGTSAIKQVALVSRVAVVFDDYLVRSDDVAPLNDIRYLLSLGYAHVFCSVVALVVVVVVVVVGVVVALVVSAVVVLTRMVLCRGSRAADVRLGMRGFPNQRAIGC